MCRQLLHESEDCQQRARAGTAPGASPRGLAVRSWTRGRGRGRRSPPRPAASRGGRLFGLAEVANDRFERVDDFVPAGAALGKADFEVERFGRRPVGEDVVLGAPRPRLGGGGAQLLPCGGAALAGEFLDQGGHFLGRILPNYL